MGRAFQQFQPGRAGRGLRGGKDHGTRLVQPDDGLRVQLDGGPAARAGAQRIAGAVLLVPGRRLPVCFSCKPDIQNSLYGNRAGNAGSTARCRVDTGGG